MADITDESGFTPSGEDLDPKQAMRTALEAALTKANLLGTEYKLKIEISEYEPGNAFARWVLPGLGGTYLRTRTYVQNADNGTVATIPVNRTVAAGGAFTIGAWRECFNEVAEEIVKILKQEMGLLPKKSKTSADS